MTSVSHDPGGGSIAGAGGAAVSLIRPAGIAVS